MKNRLKYIIVLLCIISAWSIANPTTTSLEVAGYECTDQQGSEGCTVNATSIIFPDAGLYLARTGSPININIAQQCNRRNDTETRLNTSYLKSGKIINTGVSFSIFNNLKLFYSVLSEPIHRLISLGRLII